MTYNNIITHKQGYCDRAFNDPPDVHIICVIPTSEKYMLKKENLNLKKISTLNNINFNWIITSIYINLATL